MSLCTAIIYTNHVQYNLSNNFTSDDTRTYSYNMDEKKFVPYNSDLADFFLCTRNSANSEVPDNLEYQEPKELNEFPIKRKNLRQPKDASGKFYKTLPGFLISYIETQGPTPEHELLKVLAENLPHLRNACGSLYKNTPLKCLNGICRMPIFIVKDAVWDLNIEEVKIYREQFITKTKKTVKAPEREKKGMRKTEKIVALLRSYSAKLSKDPRTERLVKDPLKELDGNEDLQEAARKIGFERLIGILQSYSVVSKHFIMLMKREQSSVQFNNIEKDIEGIYSKLARIEGHLLKFSNTSSKSESNP